MVTRVHHHLAVLALALASTIVAAAALLAAPALAVVDFGSGGGGGPTINAAPAAASSSNTAALVGIGIGAIMLVLAGVILIATRGPETWRFAGTAVGQGEVTELPRSGDKSERHDKAA